jgi:hypothetical protein
MGGSAMLCGGTGSQEFSFMNYGRGNIQIGAVRGEVWRGSPSGTGGPVLRHLGDRYGDLRRFKNEHFMALEVGDIAIKSAIR